MTRLRIRMMQDRWRYPATWVRWEGRDPIAWRASRVRSLVQPTYKPPRWARWRPYSFAENKGEANTFPAAGPDRLP